jgi:hypothetical protein
VADMKIQLNTPTQKMFISSRAKQALLMANINSVEDLISQTKTDLERIPNFGKKSIDEVRKMLSVSGFSLLNDSKTIDDYVFENSKMSLRDQFASTALQGLLSATGQQNDRSLVFAAYAYADMMMEARNG